MLLGVSLKIGLSLIVMPSEVAEEAMGRLEAMHKGAWVIGTIGRRQDKDEEQVKILF